MVLLFQETLLHSLTHRLLFRDRRRQPLIESLGRPRRKRRIHLRLLLPPRDLQRLMREEQRLRGRPQLRHVRLKLQKTVRQVLVVLEEGLKMLLVGGVRRMVTG